MFRSRQVSQRFSRKLVSTDTTAWTTYETMGSICQWPVRMAWRPKSHQENKPPNRAEERKPCGAALQIGRWGSRMPAASGSPSLPSCALACSADAGSMAPAAGSGLSARVAIDHYEQLPAAGLPSG